MACASGSYHTITLSDGVVYCFGENDVGQLGLEHNNGVLLPSRIPNLPQIKQVACGHKFTICVDYDGFMWSFGENHLGQLGTGNTTNFNVPQQILEIPPVLFVACGSEHTLIITNDSNLWSSGRNDYGQLCLGSLNESKHHSTFQQTSFSNISRISCGNLHSLFQNNIGEIYSCGYNYNGELGLGHFKSPYITPTKIPNLPSNIVQFICGYGHTLFLDVDGFVFSVGANFNGQLGDHNSNQNVLSQIPNIPLIQTISCASYSSYLIDLEGNWSFGSNVRGQLGHGERKNVNTIPKKLESLKDIQQVSYGCCAFGHFLVKDSQNKIFATGYNSSGQLGTGNTESLSTLKEISAQYCTIWGESQILTRAKSARK